MKISRPLFASVLAISMFVFFIACNKDDENNEEINDLQITVNSPWQVSFTIDGINYSYVESTTNDISGGYSASISYPPNDSTSASYNSWMMNFSAGTSIIGVDKGVLKFMGGQADEEVFKSFFAPGPYNYSQEEGIGFWIYWYDENNDPWCSAWGTGNQDGSSITIDDAIDEIVFFDLNVKVKISFNCTVYNESGNAKKITNGVYVGKFQNM